MDYTIYIIIGFIIVPLGIFLAYRKDYKQNKSEFKATIKTVGIGLIIILLIFGLKKSSEYIIPLKEKYGTEFNSERKKLGIPILAKDWEINKSESKQFITYWWKPEPRNGHFKKVIEYGILNAKTETDYYQNENQKGTFAWSQYNFENNTFEYFIEKPNDKSFTIADKGNLKFEPTKILKISRAEFEKYTME